MAKWSVWALAGMACVAGSGRAQLVLPPKDAPAPSEPYVLPPKNPVPPPKPTIPVTAATPRAKVELPDLPYKPLAQKDASGALIDLSEPADLAALRVNPTIEPKDWSALEPYLKQRLATVEEQVIANLDLMERIEGGLLDQTDPMDKERGGLKTVLDTTKPLSIKSMTQDLRSRNLLSDLQAEFNNKIVREYTGAVASGGQSTPDRKANASDTVRRLIRQAIQESTLAYHGLLREAGTRGAAAVDALAWDASAKDAARKALAQMASPSATREYHARARQALSALSLEQRQDLLRQLSKTR